MLKWFLFVLTVLRAGRSVWYDRHVGIVEAAGSNPAQSTSTSFSLILGTPALFVLPTVSLVNPNATGMRCY